MTASTSKRKNREQNILVVNKTVHKILNQYLNEGKLSDEDYLFKSKRGNQALTIQAVNAFMKKWTSAINLKGNYGAHSMRKTWGYFQGPIMASVLRSYVNVSIILVSRDYALCRNFYKEFRMYL